MSINLIKINGQSQFIDYSQLESTFKSTIGKRCSSVSVFVYNNFPVSVSVEANVDVILVIAVEPKPGNYYRLWKNDRWVYLYNLIIPIKFVTHLKNEKLLVDENQIINNDELIDYSSEISSIRFSLIDYLAKRCDFNKDKLFIQPIIFIQNEQELIQDNYLVSQSFDFESLIRYLKGCSFDIFRSYKEWSTPDGYTNIVKQLEVVTEQASKDSEIGYLTKKKIDRIGKQLSSTKKIYEELNSHLVIISGKAGTGKSSELLLLAMKSIEEGKNALFLTYNKLLVYDIAKTIKSYSDFVRNDKVREKVGESSILSLHGFFYRLSKSLGVLHALSSERILKLLLLLQKRMRLCYDFLENRISDDKLDINLLKTDVQNNPMFDIGTKEVGVDFLTYISKKEINSKSDFKEHSRSYYQHKKDLLEGIEANDVFITDYYGVLENTLLAIQDPRAYFERHSLQNKFDLLEKILSLKPKHHEVIENEIKIKVSGFTEQKNRKVGGHRRKRTLFIDEAQDCHRLEKDILISIYGSDNIVIANGGKEQLIRHVELCNWEVSQAKKLNVKKHYTRNKSYRVKKTVVDFSNFIAKKYNIDLHLEPLESDDEGELIFDFRQNHSEKDIKEILDSLTMKGEVHGCTPYEQLLVLLESNSQRSGTLLEEGKEALLINEYGNIEDAKHLGRGNWNHKSSLEKQGYLLWDGTVADKYKLITPGPHEYRVIYYESCRGLESWSVACFALDKFFNQKREDPEAEMYLVEDLFFNQNNEQRKSMYAATWALMAITRVIDTLYIQINDKNSEFGKLVEEYLNTSPRNVKEINFIQ